EKAERSKTHKKEEAEKNEVRASMTDPEARLMRFSDGATRLGYNVHLAVDPASGIILGAAATDRRNDAGMAGPMLGEVERHLGRRPKRVLADTTYATRQDIIAFAGQDIEVYTPVPADKPDAKPETGRQRASTPRRGHM